MFNINMAANIKRKRPVPMQLALSVMAGIAISFGCIGLSFIKSDGPMFSSLSGILGGFVFSFGLFCVFRLGLELFTTNCLMSASMFSNKLPVQDFVRILWITLVGNSIGCLLMWAIFNASGFSYISTLHAIANAKTDIPWFFMFVRGMLCNMVLCYAGIIQMGDNSTVAKFITAFIAVILFVACGFEHSIADIFIILFNDSADAPMIINTMVSVLAGNVVGGLLVGRLYLLTKDMNNWELRY